MRGLFRLLRAARGLVLKPRRIGGVGPALVLMLTRRCNLKCRTCLRGPASNEDLAPELIDGLIAQAVKMGFKAVCFTGGEPILHPDFEQIVRKTAAAGLRLAVVTNGQRYEDYLEVLEPVRSKVAFVAVSLDSHLREVNDSIRGKGVFDRAVAGARAFRLSGYPLKISHVVTKENFRGLRSFVEFVQRSLKPNNINIVGVIATGENSALALDAAEKEEFFDEMRALSAWHRNLAPTASSGFIQEMMFCSNFNSFNELSVNSSGEVVFCCDNPYGGVPLGRLGEEKLEDIAARLFRAQARLKAALVRDRLNSAEGCSSDCNYCAKLLRELEY